MQGYWSEIVASMLSPVRLFFFCMISVFIGIIGPFGTFGIIDFPLRIVYWSIIVFAAFYLVLSLRLLCKKLFPKLRHVYVSVFTFCSTALLLTPAIIAMSYWFIPTGYTGYTPEWSLAFFVFFVGIGVDLMLYLVAPERRFAKNIEVTQVEPRLNDRIPLEIRGDVLHIKGKDHHVRVRTSLGVAKIRLRLADAIKEMDGVDGICPHRSHWVAISAVVDHGMNETPGTFYLVLFDGTRVPVSRKNVPLVQAAGLLGDGVSL